MQELGLLSRLGVVTSVSGGSILAAHIALHWNSYLCGGAELEQAARSLAKFARSDLRGRIVRRWLLGRVLTLGVFAPQFMGRTRQLRDRYDELLAGADVSVLGPTQDAPRRPEFHVLATSMTTGSLCAFSSSGVWIDDGTNLKHMPSGLIPLSFAVAASSAFPPLFPPVELNRKELDLPVADFPHERDYLADGGIYDNLGVRRIVRLLERSHPEVETLVISDASASFDWNTASAFSFVVSRTVRATDILMKRVSELELRSVRLPSETVERKVVWLSIHDTAAPAEDGDTLHPDLQRRIGKIRTDLDAFSLDEIALLMRHGYEVGKAALSSFASESSSDRPSDSFESRVQRILGTESSIKSSVRTVVRSIEGSRVRRMGLWSSSDWVSWALASLCIAPLLVPYAPLLVARSEVAETRENLRVQRDVLEQRTQALQPLLKEAYFESRVFFVTDRKQISTDADDGKAASVFTFGNSRSSPSSGVVLVNIPRSHKMGEIEAPNAFSLDFSQSREKHVLVSAVSVFSGDELINQIAAVKPENIFVYVPGLNTSFDFAARRAATMAFDLGFPGPTVLFSWPSGGGASAYLEAQVQAEWAAGDFGHVIDNLSKALPGVRINILSNGLGARIVMGALTLPSAPGSSDHRVGSLIFLYPDVDSQIFASVAPQLARVASDITVYRSPTSLALKAAQNMYAAPRLGLADRPPPNVPQVDFIDTPPDPGLLGSDLTTAYSDLFYIVTKRLPASQRPHLVAEGSSNHWRLNK